jgi:dolichol-phosphate mannosyltransferase
VKTFLRFVRFGLVGGSGVLVNQAVLYLLHDPQRLALPLLPSAAASAQVAMINNFVWNEFWTFADRVGGRAGANGRLARFLKFEVICLVGLAISLGVLNLCTSQLHMHYLIGNLVAIGVSTAWNFLLNLRFNWSARRTAGEAP